MLTYTPLVLFGLGVVGILLHNLIELNKINKAKGGRASIWVYLVYERFSLAISVITVATAVYISQEIKQLEAVGKWLGLAFISIGYMGQSLLIVLMGKTEKFIGKDGNGHLGTKDDNKDNEVIDTPDDKTI